MSLNIGTPGVEFSFLQLETEKGKISYIRYKFNQGWKVPDFKRAVTEAKEKIAELEGEKVFSIFIFPQREFLSQTSLFTEVARMKDDPINELIYKTYFVNISKYIRSLILAFDRSTKDSEVPYSFTHTEAEALADMEEWGEESDE